MRLTKRDWGVGLLVGTLLGLVLLGIGGRVAMRAIAVAANQPVLFSIGGSITVIALGAATGAVVALVFLVARTLFPSRRWARVAIFWTVCIALALRGLNPVTTLNTALFIPLVLLHGGLLHLFWCRSYLPRRTAMDSVSGGRA